MDYKKHKKRVVDLANAASIKEAIEDLRRRNETLTREVNNLVAQRRSALLAISAIVAQYGDDGELTVGHKATATVSGAEHVELKGRDVHNDEGEKIGYDIDIRIRQATPEERQAALASTQKQESRIVVPTGSWRH